MSRCSLGILTGEADGRKAAFCCTCGRTDCDLCGPRKTKRLRARCYAAAPNRGIDLTIRHEDGRTLEQEAALLDETWHEFVRKWNREHPNGKIEYFKVWEVKGPRHVHIHIVARCPFIPVQLLRKFFWERIRSHRQWIKTLVTGKHMIAYATKYITKAIARIKGKHSYSASHGFDNRDDLPPKDPFYQGMTWYYERTTLDSRALDWQAQGFEVTRPNEALIHARGPP